MYRLVALGLLLVLISFVAQSCGLNWHGHWGYINRRGEWVIGPTFDAPGGRFRSGLATVNTTKAWNCIDKAGKELESLKDLKWHPDSSGTGSYPSSHRYGWYPAEVSEGLILCTCQKPESKGKRYLTSADFNYAYLDTKGKMSLSPDITCAGSFREGLAPVQFRKGPRDKYSMWGYIDTHGTTVINPQFSSAYEFSCGLAVVEIGAHTSKGGWEHGKYGFIDRSGKLIIKPTFREAHNFTDSGLAAVEGMVGGWKFIDRSGNVAIPESYFEAGDFVDGVAPVRSGRKWGFIDTSGRWACPPTWDYADSFSEGLAAVGTDTGRYEDEVSNEWPIFIYGCVDRHFNLVIPQKFRALRPFSEGLAAAAAAD